MDKIHKTLFISDIHLSEAEPAIAERFISLLTRQDPSIDAIYILGDLFNVWIGDDNMTRFNQRIVRAFQVAHQQGKNLYYLHGNRDFLLGKKFFNETHCTLLMNGHIATIYSNHYLLMHGDLLCTNDINYLRMRRLFQQKWLQKAFLALPLNWRRHIANRVRQTSQAYNQQTQRDIMDTVQNEVEKRMLAANTNVLIHGHTHRPNQHQFTLHEQAYQRIVLPAWEDQTQAFAVYADGHSAWLAV